MAKSSGKLGWQGVVSGTPCADPKDNRPDYSKGSGGAGDWRGLNDTTPTADGKSQSIKISGGKDKD
jgi:hypothetical protein